MSDGSRRQADPPRREPDAGVGRRAVLAGSAVVGTGLLAGCPVRSDGAPDEPGTSAATTWTTTVRGSADEPDVAALTGTLGAIAYGVGFVVDPETGERTFVLATDVEETPDTVRVSLREGLEWTNGEPLTAGDIGRWLFMLRMGASRFAPVPHIRSGRRRPASPMEAITDVEWDDTTLTVTGRFDEMASPLPQVNSQLGSRPGTYYDDLWRAFRAAYDDVPWEDDETWTAVTDMVDGNIWALSAARRPEAGVRLEADYDGHGWEAAFSGPWYPVARRGNRLRLVRNDTHPAADRLNVDELVWRFSPEPDAVTSALRAGRVDGAMQTDVQAGTLEALPSGVDAFPGPHRGVDTLAANLRATPLADRNARAALQYAIDRTRIVDDTNLATKAPVAVPGADLQSDRWLSTDLRGRLRRYEHDPGRAASLLADAGFTREDGAWRTPVGDPLEIEILTDEAYHPVELAIAAQLRDFGMDASVLFEERGTYRQRLERRHFGTTTRTVRGPNAAGLRRTRTAAYVDGIPHGDGFPVARYLEEAVRDAVADTPGLALHPGPEEAPIYERRLVADSLDALRAVTVPAPPFGEPDGDPEPWPYLYHAAVATSAPGVEDRIAHAERCTWIYNYQLPELELLIETPYVFHRTDDWEYPAPDADVWRRVQWGRHPGGLWAALTTGAITAA